jgi:hypothetical protein
VKAVIWLIITQILAVLSLFLWLIMAGLSLLAFDTGYKLLAMLFVAMSWLYPLLPIGCATLARWLYRHGKQRSSLITTSIPQVVVLPLVLYGAWALLESASSSWGHMFCRHAHETNITRVEV